MSTNRKKWSTSTVPGGTSVSRPSKVAAYRYIEKLAEDYRLGMLRRDLTHVIVWVTEDGRRSQYERINLAELAAVGLDKSSSEEGTRT